MLLPALETLRLIEVESASAGPDGAQLVKGLGVGALPAVTCFELHNVCTGDAGASALAAALDRGALPRLKELVLRYAAIGDAGLVALAPALRRRPALETLDLAGNPFGDEGLAGLVAPPPADAPPPQAEVPEQLKCLNLNYTQITDDGCAHLASRLNALPALTFLCLGGISASDAAIGAVYAGSPAGKSLMARMSGCALTKSRTRRASRASRARRFCYISFGRPEPPIISLVSSGFHLPARPRGVSRAAVEEEEKPHGG